MNASATLTGDISTLMGGEVLPPVSDGCGGTLECGGGVPCANGEIPACCAGQCVDLFFDEENCGECGNVCTGQASCVAGDCIA